MSPTRSECSMPLSTSTLTRVAIRFMFMGQQQRLTREGMAELLRVDLHDVLFTTWRTTTSSLLVVQTHLSYLPTRRSVSCSSSRSSPAHPGH
jgi:hypothetical protein